MARATKILNKYEIKMLALSDRDINYDNFYKEELIAFCKCLNEECKKQKEVIDDCKEDISNLLDIINKNCNELKCTSDEWLVIQKYQDKEVSE